MADSGIREKLLTKLEEVAPEHGIDIVDVEIVGATKAPTVRIRIDLLESGITLDQVTAQNNWISAIVEELDPFVGQYNLEISSPGVDRPLRRLNDFKRYVGSRCEISTTATSGRKKWTGTIASVDENASQVKLELENETQTFDLHEIKKAHIKAELSFKSTKKVSKERM